MHRSLLLLALATNSLAAQVAPVNDAPNPYQTIEGWARMPAGRTWGSTSAVEIDKDGRSIWVFERCGQNSCAESDLDPILKFDRTGTLVRSFGKGMFIFPHGIDVDDDGNVWVVDCACLGRARPDSLPPKGHQVFKFSPEGRLLLTLGKAGGSREPGQLFQPNDVLVTRDFIFVAEGHASAAGAHARISKFDKTGKFIRAFGTKGAGKGEFDQPHALAMDSRGRLFIGDRSNNRIVIADQDGNWQEEWYQFSRASGIWIDANDMMYVTDSESKSVARNRTDWERGIRIGSVKDGKVLYFIPDPDKSPPSTSAAEGIAVDHDGNIYGAEVGPKRLQRYVKKP